MTLRSDVRTWWGGGKDRRERLVKGGTISEAYSIQ